MNGEPNGIFKSTVLDNHRLMVFIGLFHCFCNLSLNSIDVLQGGTNSVSIGAQGHTIACLWQPFGRTP